MNLVIFFTQLRGPKEVPGLPCRPLRPHILDKVLALGPWGPSFFSLNPQVGGVVRAEGRGAKTERLL